MNIKICIENSLSPTHEPRLVHKTKNWGTYLTNTGYLNSIYFTTLHLQTLAEAEEATQMAEVQCTSVLAKLEGR